MISESLTLTVTTPVCENETECSNLSNFPCHHCPKRLCLKHLIEHNTLNLSRADELSNELDNFTNIVLNFNTQQSFQNARDKLDQWKYQTLEDIEKVHQLRSNEINQLEIELNNRLSILKDSLKSSVLMLQTQLSTLQDAGEISQQQLSPIECDLNQLRQCLQSVRCEISFEIKNISFHDLFNVHNVFSYNRTLTNMTQIQSYRRIPLDNMKEFISSKSHETILWLDTQRQLYYMDKKFQNHRLTIPEMCLARTSDVNIVDIKWFPFAELFLILCPEYLFSFDPKTGKFTPISINRYQNHPFQCISCFTDASFYIAYGTSDICIELWNYPCDNSNDSPMNECIKRWDRLSNDKTEWLSHMNTSSGSQLGLLICRGSSIYRRFELRDKHLNFLRKIQFNNDYITAFFPYQSKYWFIKTLSKQYYIYSVETNRYSPSTINFPFGLQEFGMHSVAIGNHQGELIICDL